MGRTAHAFDPTIWESAFHVLGPSRAGAVHPGRLVRTQWLWPVPHLLDLLCYADLRALLSNWLHPHRSVSTPLTRTSPASSWLRALLTSCLPCLTPAVVPDPTGLDFLLLPTQAVSGPHCSVPPWLLSLPHCSMSRQTLWWQFGINTKPKKVWVELLFTWPLRIYSSVST